MTQPTAPPATEPATEPASRRLVLTSTTGVALVSTAAAYVAMVAFGRDVLDMTPAYAYSFAGVFELSLVTVALMAREAAQDNRPNATLLSLTWLLSAASGVFAAWHEIYIGHPVAAAAFRFCVPLLAALMWHLALVGDRHLATGRSWSQLRTGARMHALFLTTEAWHRAAGANDGSRRSRRRIERANARRLRARSVALRTVPPTDMDREVAQWTAALEAVTRGTDAAARSATDNVHPDPSGGSGPKTKHLARVIPEAAVDESVEVDLADLVDESVAVNQVNQDSERVEQAVNDEGAAAALVDDETDQAEPDTITITDNELAPAGPTPARTSEGTEQQGAQAEEPQQRAATATMVAEREGPVRREAHGPHGPLHLVGPNEKPAPAEDGELDEELLIARILELDADAGKPVSRRVLEEDLTQVAGQKIGSTIATRLGKVARSRARATVLRG